MTNSANKQPASIYVVSGGKGIAGNNMVQSLLIQYPNNNIPVVIIPDVSTVQEIEKIIIKAQKEGSLVTHTMVLHTG